MALKFFDGLGLYKSGSEATLANPAMWVYSAAILTNGGRFGGGCAYARSGSSFFTLNTPTPQDGVCFFGASVCLNALTDTYIMVFAGSSGAWLGKVGISTDGRVTIYSQSASGSVGTPIAKSTKPVLSVGRWSRWEIKFIPGSASDNGSITVHIDGAEVLNASGIDTNNGTETLSQVIAYGLYNSNDTWRMDDVMFWDDSGGQNNDFMGDLRIDELLPTDNGADQDWPANTGAAYAAVDDALVSADDDTTYISSSTVNAKSSFVMSDLANTSVSIMGVKTRARIKNTDAGARTVKTYMQSGAATAPDAADTTPTTAYAVIHGDIHEVNPDGDAAWTDSAVNALVAGVAITS